MRKSYRPVYHNNKASSKRVLNVDEIFYQLEQWYRNPLGSQLLKAERTAVNSIVSEFPGLQWLQIGGLLQREWCSQVTIPHKISVSFNPHHSTAGQPFANNSIASASLYSRCDLLPFPENSMDAVILPHILEYVPDPFDVIQEGWRVLIPEGHIIILFFNVHSLWGIKRLFMHKKSQPPWNGNFLKINRIQERLTDLGCDIIISKTLFFRPPLQHETLLNKLSFLEMLGQHFLPHIGAVSLMVAKKKIITLTPLKPKWEPAKVLVPKGLEPTARGMK